MAEPSEIPFGAQTRVGPRNHVLSGGPDPQREGAIVWDIVQLAEYLACSRYSQQCSLSRPSNLF